MHLAQVPVNNVVGNELRPAGQWRKALGPTQRPLGTPRDGWVISDDIYRAVLDGVPYRVRGLVGFGVNLILSHSDAARGAEALRNLEFHVQTEAVVCRIWPLARSGFIAIRRRLPTLPQDGAGQWDRGLIWR